MVTSLRTPAARRGAAGGFSLSGHVPPGMLRTNRPRPQEIAALPRAVQQTVGWAVPSVARRSRVRSAHPPASARSAGVRSVAELASAPATVRFVPAPRRHGSRPPVERTTPPARHAPTTPPSTSPAPRAPAPSPTTPPTPPAPPAPPVVPVAPVGAAEHSPPGHGHGNRHVEHAPALPGSEGDRAAGEGGSGDGRVKDAAALSGSPGDHAAGDEGHGHGHGPPGVPPGQAKQAGPKGH